MRTSLLLLVALICCAVATPAAAFFGGWKPIKYIDHPVIQGLGEWAVDEHVKQANDGIKFKKVVSGKMKAESGVKYRLTIRGLNIDDVEHVYKAVVHEGPSPNGARTLVSFSKPRSLEN